MTSAVELIEEDDIAFDTEVCGVGFACLTWNELPQRHDLDIEFEGCRVLYDAVYPDQYDDPDYDRQSIGGFGYGLEVQKDGGAILSLNEGWDWTRDGSRWNGEYNVFAFNPPADWSDDDAADWLTRLAAFLRAKFVEGDSDEC